MVHRYYVFLLSSHNTGAYIDDVFRNMEEASPVYQIIDVP